MDPGWRLEHDQMGGTSPNIIASIEMRAWFHFLTILIQLWQKTLFKHVPDILQHALMEKIQWRIDEAPFLHIAWYSHILYSLVSQNFQGM